MQMNNVENTESFKKLLDEPQYMALVNATDKDINLQTITDFLQQLLLHEVIQNRSKLMENLC